MKSFFAFSALALILTFSCSSAFAQSSTGKKPDLVTTSLKLQRLSKTELNVIWTIRNAGDGDARLVDLNRQPLVSYLVEGTGKREITAGTQWALVSNNVPILSEKTVLKPGESVSGSFSLPYVEQDNLVSYRFQLDPINVVEELKKENNTFISRL